MGEYADVNGVHLYYEVHGQGRPTVLLHGGLGATSMFGPNLPALANGRKVIDFDLSKQVATIKTPTMFVAGDADIFPPKHAVEIFELLGGGKKDGGWMGEGRSTARLAILPGVTHYAMGAAPALMEVVIPFLDED